MLDAKRQPHHPNIHVGDGVAVRGLTDIWGLIRMGTREVRAVWNTLPSTARAGDSSVTGSVWGCFGSQTGAFNQGGRFSYRAGVAAEGRRATAQGAGRPFIEHLAPGESVHLALVQIRF